jgi:hypothetical protein
VLRIDRVARASKRDRTFHSGEHKAHGVNVQVIADPAGRLVQRSHPRYPVPATKPARPPNMASTGPWPTRTSPRWPTPPTQAPQPPKPPQCHPD